MRTSRVLNASTAFICFTAPSIFATTLTISVPGDANVNTSGKFNASTYEGDLRGALNFINLNPSPESYEIQFNLGKANTIKLGADLPPLKLPMTNEMVLSGLNMGGNQIVIDGNDYRAFLASQGKINIANLTITNVVAAGKEGGAGSGGGLGAGAALFVDHADVIISNLTVLNASAKGGNGSINTSGGGSGGGGAGFGGAFYVNEGGSLKFQGAVNTGFTGSNSTKGGKGAIDGWHAGDDAFFVSNAQVILDPNGQTITFYNPIADDSSSTFEGAHAGINRSHSSGVELQIGDLVSPAGTVEFVSANSISGEVTLQKGALALHNNRSLGSASVNFAGEDAVLQAKADIHIKNEIILNAGGTLDPNGHTLSIDTPLTGQGGITIRKGGKAVFSETNTYEGETTIDGTLEVKGSIEGHVKINSEGALFVENNMRIKDLVGAENCTLHVDQGKTLTFGTDNPSTFEGKLSGNGTIIKEDSGTFTLSGDNSFVGTFVVKGGTVKLGKDSIFPSGAKLNIASDATLTGIGSLGGVSIDGIVAPGNSIGTLNVSSVSFDKGSNYMLEFDETASDLIASNGPVTINPGAGLTLSYSLYTTPLEKYTIVTSNEPISYNSEFNLINPLPRYNFAVEYDPYAITLAYVSVNDFYAKGNAGEAAKCFNRLIDKFTPDLVDIATVLYSQSRSAWQDSFDQLQPANFNDIAFAQTHVAERVRQTYSVHLFEQRVEACPTEKRISLWFTPFVEKVHQTGDGDSEHLGYRENFSGFTAAADYLFVENWMITGGFSFADSNLHIVDGKAHGDFKTYSGSFGAIWTDDHLYIDALASYLFSTINGKRKIHLTGVSSIDRMAHHSQDSNQYLGHLGAGYDFKFSTSDIGTVNLYPFIDVDYLYITQTAYDEHGAKSLDLKVSAKNYDYLRPEAGIGIGYTVCFEYVNIISDLSASFVREFRFLGKKTKAHFNGSSCEFTVEGLDPENNLVVPQFRITGVAPKIGLSISLLYHGEYGAHFIENAGEAELKFSF